MERIDNIKANSGSTAAPWELVQQEETLVRRGSLFAAMASLVSLLALFALPAGLAFTDKNYIYGKIPFLKQLGFRAGSARSAVLALDIDGVTIQTRTASAQIIDSVEKAALAQLADLHLTYSAWAENHEDLSGALVVKLRVDKSGNVLEVDPVAARLSNAIFTRVVLGEIRRWTFPGGLAEPLEITMPLLFVPKGLDTGTVVHWERKTRGAEPNEATVSAARAAEPASRPNSQTVPSRQASSREPAQKIDHRPAAPKPTPGEPAQPPLAALKTTQPVGLRPQPRYSAPRIYELDAETELNLIETQGDWFKVRVAKTESMGFVRKEFLAPIN